MLGRLLGRLPLGWLQLTHNRARLAAALAGVAFANILVFMQLGFLGALMGTVKLPYELLAGDIMISSSDARTMTEGGNIARQHMYKALAVPGVQRAAALYVGKVDWKQPSGGSTGMQVFGFEPAAVMFDDPEIQQLQPLLQRLDYALIDRHTRNVDADILAAVARHHGVATEINGRTVRLADTFALGGGFSADGYLLMSEQSFLRLFAKRSAGAPNHIIVTLMPGASPAAVVEQLRAVLPARSTQVRTLDQAGADEQSYQTTEKPVGLIFGFGVVIGIMVGMIIVYQLLSTDVADHLAEYATLKAMGYPQRYFLGVVFEQAAILGLLGFIPGVLISLGLYAIVAQATALPVAMTAVRAGAILVGTVVMCLVSGAIATRRLAAADPADLF